MRKKGGGKVYNVGEENRDESSSSDDDYTFCVSTVSEKLPQVNIEINEIKVRMAMIQVLRAVFYVKVTVIN